MPGAPTYKQDMPPPGGYKPINFLRVPAKTYFSGVQLFLGFTAFHFSMCYLYTHVKEHYRRLEVEDRSARLAMQPMLYAEKDRLYLKRCRQLRDEEEELMKDVPGWVVGTYWGEPIYHTRPENEWHDITQLEYWTHNPEYRRNFHKNFYKYY